MKKSQSIQRIVSFLIMVALSLVIAVPNRVCADEYGYEKKDKGTEQARYMAKLTEDKKKVELAILNTKALIHKARNKPYLPELYLRLAELYIEQSRIVYYVRRTEKGMAASAFDQVEANILKNQALEVYQRILNDFPEFKAKDKVHFFMAHEYRELNQIDDMVVQYRTIIKEYPDSPYVSESYLLLGDYFISKQDLETAKKHYEAILKFPGCTAISIARYKLGWCYINQLKFQEALKLFEEVVLGAEKGKELEIDTYKRVDIKQEALMDMAFCYTECYKDAPPEEALNYFQKYSWSRQVYTAVLEKLANRYYIKKKWSSAAVVYRQLSLLEQEPTKLLEYARNTFECVQAIGTFEHADKDLALIVKALKKEKYSIHVPDEQKGKDQTDFELYARNIVTYLHDEARKKESIDDFKRSAQAYKIYLEFFNTSPVYSEMSENFAEALFSSQQYLKAGKQYEASALRMSSSNAEREDKLYSAVISYYNAIKDKQKLNYYETAFARDGLRSTGRLYASDYPQSARVGDVLFNVAWIAYDAGDYDTAINEFTKYAQAYPNSKATKASVHLILDSYNLKEDYAGLIAYGKGIIQNAAIADQQLKNEVSSIVQSSETKVISSLTVAALTDWDKGKTDLMAFAAHSKTTGMGEEALNAVIISSKEKGDVKTLLTAGADLIREYPTSNKVEGTLNMMIDSSVRMAQFRLVADYLEAYALRLPGHKNAHDFLQQAGQIREGLGQYSLSVKDYKRLIDTKAKDASSLMETVFAIADNALRSGERQTALKVLLDNRDRLTDAGKIRADARIASLYLEAGDMSTSQIYLKRAEKAYQPKASSADQQLHTDMAQAVYESTVLEQKGYMGLQLKGGLDNKIVTDKSKLLEKLEKSYQSVILYKAPQWALKACYQSYVINNEFARFLTEAPIPADLTPEQKEQYTQLISQKALTYKDKGDQYLQTCIQQGRKWEICDPELAGYFNPPSGQGSSFRGFVAFSEKTPASEISDGCLMDQELKELHEQLLKTKKDLPTLLTLCEAYMKRGDYWHASFIAQKALDEKKDENSPLMASFNTCLGVSRLYLGEDDLAKDAFKKAISLDSNSISAKVNLAALYNYYGHDEQAKQLYEAIPSPIEADKADGPIHPKAKEIYHASGQISKK